MEFLSEYAFYIQIECYYWQLGNVFTYKIEDHQPD